MSIEKRLKNPNWHCLEFNETTFVLNNVFAIPARGGKPQILRLATMEDNSEEFTAIDLSFLDINKPLYYVVAKDEEIINDNDLFWYFDGNQTPVQVYSAY